MFRSFNINFNMTKETQCVIIPILGIFTYINEQPCNENKSYQLKIMIIFEFLPNNRNTLIKQKK